MQTDATLEQVKILAKQLKVPTFAHYPDIVRRMDSGTDFGMLLLTLMKMSMISGRKTRTAAG